MQLTPYLTFNGQARAAAAFYAKALGGEIIMTQTFGEMPNGAEMDAAMQSRISHIRVQFGDRLLMISDTWDPSVDVPHSGFSLSTDWDTPEQAGAAFEALSEGGEVTMPIEATFWARAFGMCKDRFGVPWMVNCE